jgi:transcription elongation factor GreA
MKKYLTPEGLEKLKKEFDYLITTKRKEIAERLKHAASFGDLKENAAYQDAKEAQGFLEDKILKLKQIIQTAQVIEKKKQTGKVQIGSIVLVSLDGEKQKFQIVDQEEANLQERKISFQSLLGETLLGKSVGNEVKIKTPEGETRYKILKIE